MAKTISFDQLPRYLAKVKRAIGNTNVVLLRVFGGAVHGAVVRDTPVDTGKARSNWILTRDAPSNIEIGPYAPGLNLGLAETGNAAGAIAQGRVALAGLKPSTRSVHITNNVSYINILNQGPPAGSPQARAGFIESAVIKGVVIGATTIGVLIKKEFLKL